MLVLTSELALVVLAALLAWEFAVPRAAMLGGAWALGPQVIVGLVAAILLFAVLAGVVSLFPWMLDEVGGLVREVMRQARPTMGDCALISVAAGVGEELLFRAVLVPLLGPWGSALLFGIAHGLNASGWKGRLLYLSGAFAVGLLLAWLFLAIGLWAAVVCHAAYDFIALEALRREVFPWRAKSLPRAS
jgi:membrane protease YdiL (CAAX protease family)